MPRAFLNARRVAEAAGRPILPEEWPDLLFPSKAEFHGVLPDGSLEVEATADRLDLLCDAGLGAHLAGALGKGTGAIPIRRTGPAPSIRLRVDPSVAPLRPAIAAVLLEAPAGLSVDEGLLTEAIRFQELLHATMGGDRRWASFGFYPLDRLRPPITYALEPLAKIRFTPLEETTELAGSDFFDHHPMAARYGTLGRSGSDALVLRDSEGAVLSLPPVLNAEGSGSIRLGDSRVLLESTGTRPARVADGLGLLMLPFVGRGWSVVEVPRDGPGETSTGPGVAEPRRITLPTEAVTRVTGRPATPESIAGALARARIDARPFAAGCEVAVPPWRPDLLAPVDLVEEVVLSEGIPLESGGLPPSPTRGARRPESGFRDRVAEELLGAGFTPLLNPVLTGSERNARLGRSEAFRIANPVSEEWASVRDRLLPSLVGSLSRNVRYGYPQRLSEVGPVVVPDRTGETGGRTRYAAAFVRAGEGAGFADAAARVDAVLRAFGALGVREPAELPGLIPGRAAVLRVAGEPLAEMGEIHPKVLEAERIPVPVSYGEIDLSALWPMVRRSETP